MRWSLSLAVVLGSLWVASTAPAGTLTSASWTGDFQDGTPFTLTTAGGSLIASGSSTAFGASVAITVPYQGFLSGTFPFYIAQVLGGQASIGITAAGATANAGIPGAVTYIADIFPLLTIPISPGGSGTAMVVTVMQLGAATITATFFPWTPGSVSIGGLFGTTTTPNGATNMTAPLPALTAAGSFGLTPDGGGSITLVSPGVASVCAGGTTLGACDGSNLDFRTADATILTLNFVPEPGTLLLLGSSVIGLAAMTRRHRSSLPNGFD